MISKDLIHTIAQQYRLPLDGTHGISHWARVFENGCRIARVTCAKMEVVQLFAIFHDAKRTNERNDPDHGCRGADYARSLRNASLFSLSDEDFDLLYTACAYHTDGLKDGDITVQTCWDADRLDLARAGIIPDPARLCTNAAKASDMRIWANDRAAKCVMPEFVMTEWEL